MMAAEIVRVAEFVEHHWGTIPASSPWHHDRISNIAGEFRPFTVGAVLDALLQMFRSGHRYMPNPAEVYRAAATVQADRYERGIDQRPERECLGRHVWGVWHYAGGDCFEGCPDHVEHQFCRCGEERKIAREAV